MAAQSRSGLIGAWTELYRLMPARRRAQLGGLALLMLIGGVAEIAAVGSVLPFLSFLAGQDVPGVSWLRELLAGLGADTGSERLYAAAFLFMGVTLAAGAIRMLLGWATLRWVFDWSHETTLELKRRILLQPYRFHLEHNSSELLAAVQKVHALATSVLLQMVRGVAAAVLALFILAALVRIEPVTALTAAIMFGGFYLAVSVLTADRLARNSEAVAATSGERLRLLQESLGGIRDIILDQSHDMHLKTFRNVDRRFTSAMVSTSWIGDAPRVIIETTGMLVIAALTLSLVEREGGVSPALPILGAIAVGAVRLSPFLQQVYFSWSSLAGNHQIMLQVAELLRLPVPGPQEDTGGEEPPLTFAHQIELRAVSFTYARARRPALDNVSLTIPRGARVALVGRSGGGKSTLADLIMGLLEPTAGSILVDGVPITGDVRRAWRRNIAHVPQSIFLADASIAQNIALGVREAQIDWECLMESARIAQLDDVIAGLPDGYATVVGEGGVRLSGGQRQRLGIARALYKGASVLVLDEATNALDEVTEGLVLEALDRWAAPHRTLIVITHRDTGRSSCDMLVHMERGRVVKMEGADSSAGYKKARRNS